MTLKVNIDGNTLLPSYLLPAHDLCFLNHDVLVELLRSGEKSKVFSQLFEFSNESDTTQFDSKIDIFDWFEKTGRTQDRSEFLKRVAFPALLSDFLHFIYEALENSRKAKLNITYALIRKPIQETLLLFERIALEQNSFADDLITDPLKLRARNVGGIEGHVKRILAVLEMLGEQDRFDAQYLAQLRYEKVDDGFDGICNHAMHLFTEHKAIKTPPLNINFIFSDEESKQTQWYYLYSRLPYLLYYARILIEHILSTFVTTHPNYIKHVEYKIMAATLLWAPNIDEDYQHPLIDKFINATRERLTQECNNAGYGEPLYEHLIYIKKSGKLKGQAL